MTGTTLAHYEITCHLGAGGMGEVYQAVDSKMGRDGIERFYGSLSRRNRRWY